MTATELLETIGRNGLWSASVRGMAINRAPKKTILRIPVQIIDAKQSWGKTYFRITPIAWINRKPVTRPDALGKLWVWASNVTLEEEKVL